MIVVSDTSPINYLIVVSDTSPINYLLLIDEIELLPRLFGRLFVPEAVWNELRAPRSPEVVKSWTERKPEWLKICQPIKVDDSITLGAGEREAISLAKELSADLVLIDDLKARNFTR